MEKSNKTYFFDETGKEICYAISGILPVYEAMFVDDMGAVYKVTHSKLVIDLNGIFYLNVHCKFRG